MLILLKSTFLICLLSLSGLVFSNNLLIFASKSLPITLEGKSFDGQVRANGIMGFWGVDGTLSFNQGYLTWTTKGHPDKARYEFERRDGVIYFKSQYPGENKSMVYWSGKFDGSNIYDVQAVWDRSEEDDLIHDLFLSDVVTLEFKPTVVKK